MFRIVSDSDFFYGSDPFSDLFTCTLYCITENGAFPDDSWTDFAQIVLTWWATEVLRISNAKYVTFKLLFMDGPYWISGTKTDNEVTLRFDTDKYNPFPLPSVHISFYELAASIEKAIRQLSSSLYLHGDIPAAEQMRSTAVRLQKGILTCPY